jgi:AcrR family transcriptional regulator
MASHQDLRKWRLPRGRHGLPRELVARSQRERLLAAVVRVTAAKGYDSTSVADILEEAGVGRESFYELFQDKRDCMLAARALLVENLVETILVPYGSSASWPERVRDTLGAGLEWFASDPAAARVVMIEVAAVGPASRELFQADFRLFTRLVDEGLEEGAPAPPLPQASSLAVGTALARVYEEVVRGRAAELPSLLPELTYEVLVPFLGEEGARTAASGGAPVLQPPQP